MSKIPAADLPADHSPLTAHHSARLHWKTGLAFLLLLVGLPLLGTWGRHTSEHRCALDGGRIVAPYRVRIVDSQSRDHEFCCLRCAELWLEHQSASPQAIYVTDEAREQEMDAAAAVFVRSLVVTTPTTGNRVHAFRSRAEAEKHAALFGGRVLLDSERPLLDKMAR